MSWARRTTLAVLAVLTVLVAWTLLALLSARDNLERGRRALTTATTSDDDATGTRERLDRAAADLRKASGRLSAPGPVIVSYLPLIGRTPRAARVTTDAALAAVVAAQDVLRATTGSALVSDGRLDPVALAGMAKELRRAGGYVTGPVRDLRALKTGLVPDVVAAGVLDARDRLDELPATLARAADTVDALAAVTGADGPQRLLVVLENNAELRGTGGLVSVFAEATADGGRITLNRFRDVDEVADTAKTAKRVPAPADYRRLWGTYLADTTLWKNTNMSPDVPTSSQVLAGVAAASLGRRPDAIIWLDVRAVAAVIGATRPATLPDGSVLTGTSTVDLLLSGSYRGTADDRQAQAARRARLRAAADAVAARLLKGAPDASRLSLALAGAARGRHLALWSADAARQRAFAASSLTGAVSAEGGDLTSFVTQNFGGGDTEGNKLDYYARRATKVRVRVARDTAVVQQEVTLRNTAPARGLPRYVAGGATPSTMNNFVTLALPKDATAVSFRRGDAVLSTDALPEGDHAVLTDALSLPPGTAVTWRLQYRLPLHDGRYELRLLPQPLAVDAALDVRISAAPGVRLTDASGRTGAVVLDQSFDEHRTVEVTAEKPGLLSRTSDAVRRFWREPVRLPV